LGVEQALHPIVFEDKMKIVSVIISLLLAGTLFGVTWEVSLDGQHQFSSIQSAVNASMTGDIVLVYPGRYIENINLNHHNVTIASLYSINPQQSYIDSTIIDGNLDTCITAINGEVFTVNGFTLVNNEQNAAHGNSNNGGAFSIWYDCHVVISNCIVRDCVANYGGAVSAGLGSVIEFSNVTFHSNRALNWGGGIRFGGGGQIVWNSQFPSRVYDNVAPLGMDFYINNCPETMDIQLAIGSVSMSNSDNYFIVYAVDSAPPNVTINQGYFTPIDSDLFVNPSGSDTNSGLSAATPFKTIKHALQLITSNPINPRMIHLSAGVYSVSANEQVFPLALKPHIKLVGAGSENTALDGEMLTSFLGAYRADGLCVSNIKFINSRYSLIAPITILHSNEISLRNLVFNNNSCDLSSGITLVVCQNVIIENIIAGNTEDDTDISTLYTYDCENIYMNNFISQSNTITSSDWNNLGFYFDESDVVLRNSIIANNTAQDGYLLCYQNIDASHTNYNLDMSNVLISNNNVPQCSWVFAPVYLQNRFQSMKITNCTFARNNSNRMLSDIFGYADIYNLISYNPQSVSELYLRNNISSAGIQADVSISNSLFRTASVYSDLPNLVTFTDNILGGDPLFLGMITDSLDVSQPEYYYLSANSPCINTGVADTTGLNLSAMDLAGNYRVWNGRIDMGCYEYGSNPVANDNPEYPPLPDMISLSTYPNPVYLHGSKGAYTYIEFTIPEASKEKPTIEIYNLKGQRVRTIKLTEGFNSLVSKAGLGKQVSQKSEFFSTLYDCKDDYNQKLASGIYLIKVMSGKRQTTSKFTILK